MFKASGVKTDVPKILMVHHQDVFVEIRTRLQTTQQEIQNLHDQLRDSDATIRAYQRMVAGEARDLYASDTCTWSATSSRPGAKDEPAINRHLYLVSHLLYNKFASLERLILINDWDV
jgi:hypothetical protein